MSKLLDIVKPSGVCVGMGFVPSTQVAKMVKGQSVRVQAWALPGGFVTTSKTEAESVAAEIHRLIKINGGSRGA